MTQAGFLAPSRTSPTAIAIVVLMHGAAITALALSKIEVITDPFKRTILVDIPDKPPPPPEKPPERTETPQRPTAVDMTRRIVQVPAPPPIYIPQPPPIEVTATPTTRTEAAPTPPPPWPRTVEPARARANLASYVSNDDYPTAAIRNEEQGTTRFRLGVGADGRVTDCIVTASSGSSVLDSATCRLMRSRARFTPARDSEGKARGDTVSSAIVWMLPDD
jgi:periplasmic protein TonB